MAEQKLAAARLLALAKSAERVGDAAGATGHYQTVLARYPGNRTAHAALARLTGGGPPGDGASALALYRAGRFEAALAMVEPILLRDPRDRAAHDICAACYHEMGRHDKALALRRTALEIWPQDAGLWRDCGAVLMELMALQEAQACIEISDRLAPGVADTQHALGHCLHLRGAVHDALKVVQQALKIDPGHFQANSLLGRILRDLSQQDEARAAQQAALDAAKSPRDRASAQNALGVLAVAVGQVGRAREHYRKAIHEVPDHTQAHLNLSIVAHYSPRDPHLAQLHDLAARTDLPLIGRARAQFALFNALDEVDNGSDAAFAALAEGNRLRQAFLGYDINGDARRFAELETLFASLPAADPAPPPADAPRPIFIVGLPRSGTTLTERVLSAAPGVRGAGEIPVVETQALALLARLRQDGRTSITPDDLAQFAAGLRKQLTLYAGGADVITDKMPQDFRYTPLLLAALPDAHVVHVTRDPMETCWSNFRVYFASDGNGFVYGQDSLARYHALYTRFMRTCHAAGSPRLHALSYENLVDEFEPRVRRLVRSCELDWSDACLHPEKSSRAVLTASALQARRKPYNGNRGSWQAYARHLTPLVAGLGASATPTGAREQSLPNSPAPG